MKKFLIILTLAIATIPSIAKKGKQLSIIYIGNSITQGVRLADQKAMCPPAMCSAWLSQQDDIESVDYANCGVSGKTTIDYLPSTATFFKRVTAAADTLSQRKGILLFSFMLGTNDSAIKGPHGAPVSGTQYFTNVRSIIDELLYRYPKAIFVLHQPTWYSPNTYNSSMYLKEGLERLHSYTKQLEALVQFYTERAPGHVFMGDLDAYDYFEHNYLTDHTPENGQAGTFYLHPNQKGAKALGEFWGKAIMNVIMQEK